MNHEIEDLVNDVLHQNHLVKINDNLYLKQYQKDILDYYHVDYEKCSSVSEVILLVETILDSEDIEDEELDDVVKSLQEFQYYNYTNK